MSGVLNSVTLPIVEHEFPISDAEFVRACQMIADVTGISMSPTKRHLVVRRLSPRLRALGLDSFDAYLNHIATGDFAEREHFCNAVTTNLTSFFRESHHFDYLAKDVVPELRARATGYRPRLRIWSAGCSTGEEPYSIAMVLRESLPDIDRWDARVLCTDIDTDVLRTGRAGLYGPDRVRGLAPARLNQWFERTGDDPAAPYRVTEPLQRLLAFKRLNLMAQWPMRGPFDVIFCRNTIIYFDRDTQRRLIERMANLLSDDGVLILGHSETLHRISDRFRLIGRTVYRKAGHGSPG